MRKDKRLCKGFTLSEIVISAIILIIVIGAFFSFFVATAHLRAKPENKFEIAISALSWLERVRTGYTASTRYGSLSAETNVELNDASSILPENYNNWITPNESNVNITNPGDDSRGVFYTVENVDLGSGINFKKISVTALWSDRES